MRVLFAEDEKSLNRIITKQLKAAGYSVDSCFDGGEAYDLITSADYDAAVFDVTMPVSFVAMQQERGGKAQAARRRSFSPSEWMPDLALF